MFGKFVSGIDLFLYAISNMTKKELKDYCFIDTASSPHNIVAKDGSLISVISINGSKKIVGPTELEAIIESFSSELMPIFKREGHQMQFVFIRDPSRVKSELNRRLMPYWDAARNMKLNLDDLFESKIEHLSKYCVYESCYLVVWSRPTIIKSELDNEKKRIQEESKMMPPAVGAQQIFNVFESLENKHRAFLELIQNALKVSEINFKLLKVKDAILEIRKSINNDLTADDWAPRLPNDKAANLPMRDKKEIYKSENDLGDKLWPSLSHQIFPTDFSIESADTIKVGDKFVSSLFMEVPPQQTRPFKMLLDQLDRDIPLQISFMIEGGGMNKMSMKALAAALLTMTYSGNRLIKEAIEDLKDSEMKGDTIVRVTVNAVTWANDDKVLNINKQTLVKVMQSWGTTDTVLCNGDPVEGFLSTVPAMAPKQPSSSFVAPLRDIIGMLPLSRQSHVWEAGSIIYRTEDGKIFPYQPGSSVQNTWNYIIFATPGSGKSVLMNSDNFASVLVPGATEIPYIGIIDIGPSSSGLIQLLKDAALPNMKHLFLYERLKNSQEYAINVFDTQLGARFPTSAERSFMVNFLTTIITPAGAEKPYPSSDNISVAVIDALYQYYADTRSGNPKEYSRYRQKEVDAMLDRHNINAEGWTWWKVVDTLFKLGERHTASLAQRYAVPLLEECVKIAEITAEIKDLYSKPEAETRESLLELFGRSISENVRMFPILNAPTQFDLGEARVVSLDLDEVGKGGNPTDDKKAAIMYLLARYIIGKNFKLDKDLIKYSPSIYHEFHNNRIESNLKTKKRICIDEYHNTAKVPSIRSQVMTDMREGRKWNLQVVLASQIYTDFDKDTREVSTGRCILSGGENYREIAEVFDLNETTREYVRSKLSGPGPGGVPFIFNVTTKLGNFSQYLYNTISSNEYWAFSTTAEDVSLRRQLSEQVGASNARKMLAASFAYGVKDYIDNLNKSGNYDEEVLNNPYKFIIEKLLKKYNKGI